MDLIYFSPLFSEMGWWRWSGGVHCPQLVKERSEIKKREVGEGWGRVLGLCVCVCVGGGSAFS